ncbi:MAG: hypothetical protein HKN85_02935 [Gammaproteobacteria bacterium]|nr:hypothetical protein [Gammaproteobacteria bacterium]
MGNDIASKVRIEAVLILGAVIIFMGERVFAINRVGARPTCTFHHVPET